MYECVCVCVCVFSYVCVHIGQDKPREVLLWRNESTRRYHTRINKCMQINDCIQMCKCMQMCMQIAYTYALTGAVLRSRREQHDGINTHSCMYTPAN